MTSLPPLTTIRKLYRGAKKDFYAACKIALKQITADLGEAVLDSITRKDQTSSRRITAVFIKATAA